MQAILPNVRLRRGRGGGMRHVAGGRRGVAVKLLLLGRKHLLPLVELSGKVRGRRGISARRVLLLLLLLLWRVHGHGHHEDGGRAGAVAAGCLDACAYEECEV